MAKLVDVHVSVELWQQIMTTGWVVPDEEKRVVKIECEDGLPEGSQLVSSGFNYETASVVLTFTHDSFVNIPVGGIRPRIDPVFREHYD